MMKEEIERARKRAEAASTRKSGYSYQSPLGAGFSFDKGKSMKEQMNPYSRKGNRQHDHIENGGFQIKYEEAYFEMNGRGLEESKQATGGREHVVERMNHRRQNRVRERGEPNPHLRRRAREAAGEADDTPCVIM